MRLRSITTAFLKNGGDYLLMERSGNNHLMPGYWYGVGGHIEPGEINRPRNAVVREIYEETGLAEHDIDNLHLKYILMRRGKEETVINYIFFGDAKKRAVVENNEGTLNWIPEENVLKLKFVDALRISLEHYMNGNLSMDEILVGVVGKSGGQSAVSWSALQNVD
ncbi:MAG: NUDIX domain-containing protein [Sedimentibacter sp.]|uniref:NUDIX domain-containing protein n=1 Tax=Sedimentibacter sp. TaxID=1960295 RepID=UPI0031592F6A